jgi:hypothetical protein
MSRIIRLVIGSLFICSTFAALPLTARVGTEGTIGGRLLDQRGEPIGGAPVIAMLQQGGPTVAAVTLRDGTFQLKNLADGDYRVDADLPGFDVARRNHIVVNGSVSPSIELVLKVSQICECITVPLPPSKEVAGSVMDTKGRLLAHAALQVEGSNIYYCDRSGRFTVRVPMAKPILVTARDGGFLPTSVSVSSSSTAPVVLKLSPSGSSRLPRVEEFKRPCRCPIDPFTHADR